MVINCREVDADCEVSYTTERADDDSEERVIATIECSGVVPPTETITVCDTVYSLTSTGKGANKVYYRGDFTIENCREVEEGCEVTYETIRDVDAMTDRVTATVDCSGGTEPEEPKPAAKKTVCDTVYSLTSTGKGSNKVYTRTGEFTTENCREVEETCTIEELEAERADDGKTETVKMKVTCN